MSKDTRNAQRSNGIEIPSLNRFDIARRLRELREQRGLTGQQVCRRTGMARSTLGMLETGDRMIGASLLAVLASAYQVTTDYVLLGRGDSGERTDRLNEQPANRPRGVQHA